MKRCCMCQEEKDTSQFKANKRKSDGLQSQCIPCQRAYRKLHYEANKQKYKDKAKKWTAEFRLWWSEYKRNLSCSVCSEDHPAVLDFHHTDPTEKESSVAKLVSYGNKARMLAEISKCVVLCANCHRKHHHEERLRGIARGEYPPFQGD